MLGFLQELINWALSAAVLAGGIWALIDAIRHSDGSFSSAGKLSKMVWVAILAVATAIAFISLPALPILNIFGASGGGVFWIGGLAASVAIIVYLVGVKPKLGPATGGSGGSRGRSTGGW
ncbi:DUF2516 family protein [Demequina lignilytica]|uniref:DUF2516 family protein n=1 Tax=Demequina lignilytica TaxID=3051663 RepID=A0AAW7M3V0_9MICO|nr:MULTISPECIES: DUF2516 family protein [unclassified Demequina]MDN4477976.1 DUF2516 family protein [Demequina sp. SYSU T00039-1]MDN4484245.1 DUF2516 family protein [Demequina sp. SYSU T0a273]MDN4487885.1 DUF2516 family protein [Demequina sp. SYSU T00039]MDN4490732.1 DUF2516 family protein [Demequina sp. SYSU T00068]